MNTSQILKGEFEHRAEEIKLEAASTPPSRGNIKVVVRPKALRGGGGHVQGGGGSHAKSFTFANNAASVDSDDQNNVNDLAQDVGAANISGNNQNGGNNNGASMFSRFLGQKK